MTRTTVRPTWRRFTSPPEVVSAQRVMIFAGIMVLSSFTLFTANCQTRVKWETVNEPGFSIEMPGKPVKHDETSSSPAGESIVHRLLVDVGYEEYVVLYGQYPHTRTMDTIQPAKILDGARDKLISMREGRKVLSEKEISLDTYSGRELSMDDPTDDAVGTIRTYWVKPRLYTIMFLRRKSEKPSANGLKFLDSFKLLTQ